jgi:hypothetical protein
MWFLVLATLAQPANPYLAQGRALAEELRFPEAVEVLKVARRVPGGAESEQLEVLELLATCLIAEGARGEAEAAFVELLTLEPDHELGAGTSPKIEEVFNEAKRQLYPGDSVSLQALPASGDELRARVVDPYRRAVQVVLVSHQDGGPWEERPLQRSKMGVRAGLDVSAGHTLEWYLEARAADGRVLASMGNAAKPQRRAVTLVGPVLVTRTTPRLQRIPAWIAVGLAVAAGVLGGVFQANSLSEAKRARGDDWADTARATNQRAVTDATVATGLFIGAGVAGVAGVVLFAW